MEPSLLSWLRTFAGDDASDLVDFADGAILLGVAQDTMEGFDELGVSQDLGGLLQSLEHAYAVSGRPCLSLCSGVKQLGHYFPSLNAHNWMIGCK
jgi:hypothetical protein